MIQSKHCDLCKHEKRSLKIGLTCRLTKKRPDFEQTCNNFNLSFTAKQNYKDVIAEFEKVSKLVFGELFIDYIRIGSINSYN